VRRFLGRRLVSVIGLFLDLMLVTEGLPRFDTLIISNSLTGMFAGGLVFQWAREEKASRELIRERMRPSLNSITTSAMHCK
jgi:hypothetical protein